MGTKCVPTCVHELPFEDWLEGKYFPGTAWFSLKPIAVTPRAKRLRNSLTGALSFYEQTERFEQPDYFFGPNAWEQWANQLESGSYDKRGHWWNSMVWSEARLQAATYFDKDWPSPDNLGKELRTQYAEISSLIAKSVTQEMSNLDRAELIRQAQDIDAQTLQNLVSCREFLLSDS